MPTVTKPKKQKSDPAKFKPKTGKTTLQTARAPSDDLAIGNLKLMGKSLSLHVSELITAVTLEETMDGASTLTLGVFDPDRHILRSSLIATAGTTVMFDQVSYTLVGRELTDANLTLVFEETAVNVLRGERGPVKANRYNTTRAQFIRSLVRQPKQYEIPFHSPEVNVRQPIAGGKIDVLTEANWITPSGGVKRARSDAQNASGAQGGQGQGWITIGGTYFFGEPGSCGTLGDGRPQYAELGYGDYINTHKPLLAPLFNDHSGENGGLPCGFAIDVEWNGKVVTAYKGDIGGGQPTTFWKMDMHTSLCDALGIPNTSQTIRIRRHV